MKIVKESEIAEFWTENPMIHPHPEAKVDPTSFLPDKLFEYMEKVQRRKGKLFQKEGDPLLSKYIDYNNLRGKIVLEIGFGTGWITSELQKKAKMVYGIELSNTSLKLSKYRFRNCKNINLRIASSENIPFKDNYFDFVVSYGVLHHAQNDNKCYKEIYRVLKPGGECFLMLYRKGGPKYWWSKLLIKGIFKGGLLRYNFNIDKFIYSVTDAHGKKGKGAPISRHYRKKDLIKIFSNFTKSIFIVTGNANEWKNRPFRILPLTNLLGAKILHFLVGISGAYWFIKLKK